MKVSWFHFNCRRQRKQAALLVAGACPKEEADRVRAHLQQCAGCRRHYEDLIAISGTISQMRKAVATAVPGGRMRARWQEQVLGGNLAVEEEREEPLYTRARPGDFSGSNYYRPWLSWGLATTALVLLALAINAHLGRREAADPLQNVALVRDTLAMFPNQVRAIVQDEHGLNLVLSDSQDVPVSAPLYIHVCDGRRCSSFLTFSGQEIVVAGQKVTVLADLQGGVILEGKHFLWSAKEQVNEPGHLKIEAKNLGMATM